MTPSVVVDTDVVSYLFKQHPLAQEYLLELQGRAPILSFMTIAELDRWVLEAGWGASRRDRLRHYLNQFAISPYTRDVCAVWAQVTVGAKAAGRRIDCADAWIAAAAISLGVPLITHNRSDYLGVPRLTIISHAR